MEVEQVWGWEGQDCGLGTQEGQSPEALEPACCGDSVLCS